MEKCLFVDFRRFCEKIKKSAILDCAAIFEHFSNRSSKVEEFFEKLR
jgi:hypothetical protein